MLRYYLSPKLLQWRRYFTFTCRSKSFLLAFGCLVLYMIFRLLSNDQSSANAAVVLVDSEVCKPIRSEYDALFADGDEPGGKVPNAVGARTGLTYKAHKFLLDDEPFYIASGAIHYFRVPRAYWHDRLTKLRAAGLNTVETYVAWNLHEPARGHFDFSGQMDLRNFLILAKSLGLHAIVRPGPYICAEWEFGGLPYWLLQDPHMIVRSKYPPFMNATKSYLRRLLDEIDDLQWQRGGNIIGFQIENEYNSFGSDMEYMLQLMSAMRQLGYVEQLFTSDNSLASYNLPGTVPALNFQSSDHQQYLEQRFWELYEKSEVPLCNMEYWSGWFDYWNASYHHGRGPRPYWTDAKFHDTLASLMLRFQGFNIYMFHGGTNFGFYNGANWPVQPQVTSYDYDAPVAEDGALRPKFGIVRALVDKYLPRRLRFPFDFRARPALAAPLRPPLVPNLRLGHLRASAALPWPALLALLPAVVVAEPVNFEALPVAQAVGFVNYRYCWTESPSSTPPGASRLRIGKQHVRDRAVVLLNALPVATIDHSGLEATGPVESDAANDALVVSLGRAVGVDDCVDVLVENLGRVNYANEADQLDVQRKGLLGPVYVDDEPLTGWTVTQLGFEGAMLLRLRRSLVLQTVGVNADALWTRNFGSLVAAGAPAVYHFDFELRVECWPRDTFLTMRFRDAAGQLVHWGKGVAVLNGVNLGRYWGRFHHSLFVPGVLLHQGRNQLLLFELHTPPPSLTVEFDRRGYYEVPML